ncbi:MAG: hypothetical protein CMJ93_08420 [Planctomycetes bacterium]|nr:hypothetical protein [Planctomycetota bacterium]
MKKLLKAARDLDPGLLLPFEWLAARIRKNQVASDAPMLVLLATPRSGSTFCYQVLCHSFEADYFSNFLYMGYRYPFLTKMLGSIVAKKYVSNFKSDHGFVEGLSGVAEANDIWKKWFDQHLCEKPPQPLPGNLARATSFFDWNYSRSKKPFITGWIGHIMYAEQMASIFPNAIFINLERDAQDVAVSLLRARQKVNSSSAPWFSARPVECEDVSGLTPHQQVVKQTLALQKRAASFSERNAERVFSIEYSELCENPGMVILRLQKYCADRQMILSLSNQSSPIPSLNKGPVRDDDYNLIAQELQDAN